MIDRNSSTGISDYLDENLFLSDFLDQDINTEDGNSSPCVMSYGRGRSGTVRSVPRPPNTALLLTVKLRAQKPWLNCDTETGSVETKVDDNEEFICSESLVKEAIMSTKSGNKCNFQIPKRGRGRAKALETAPNLLQLPGGLQQKFFSQPRLPIWKDPTDIYGDVNDYFKEWNTKGSLQRPASEPNINTAVNFDSQFPPLGSQIKTKAKKTECINVRNEKLAPSLPVKKRLPTGKDYHAYLARMEQKRHHIGNTDPGVHDSTEFPPLARSDLMKGDGLVINVVPKAVKKTEVTVNKSGGGFGSGLFKTKTDIDTDISQFSADSLEQFKYVPAEEALRSSSEGSLFDLGAMSDAVSIDQSKNTSLPHISEELEHKSPNIVPESTSRTLQFYLNAAKSHNQRITENQENVVKNYMAVAVEKDDHIGAINKGYNSGTLDKHVDTLEQKNIEDFPKHEIETNFAEEDKNEDNLEKDRDIHISNENCEEDIASQNFSTIIYQSDEESSSCDSDVPDLVTSSGSSLNFNKADMKAISDTNIRIPEKEVKLENQTLSSSSCSCGTSYLTSSSSSSQSISAYSSNCSSNDIIQGHNKTVLNTDGFTVVLDWKIHGQNVIQLEGLPLSADLTVVEELVASYGTIQGREIKWADQQKYVRYKLDSIDACDFAVECLHDTDCLYPDSNSVLICSRV